MKKVTWLGMCLAAALTLAAAVNAGDQEGKGCPGGKRGGAKHGFQGGGLPILKMAEELNLTEEQKAKIAEIKKSQKDSRQADAGKMKTLHEKMRALSEAENVSEAEIKAVANELAEDMVKKMVAGTKMRKEIMAVLTEEQKQILEQKKAQKDDKSQPKCGKPKDQAEQ